NTHSDLSLIPWEATVLINPKPKAYHYIITISLTRVANNRRTIRSARAGLHQLHHEELCGTSDADLTGNQDTSNYERFIFGVVGGITATILCLSMDTNKEMMGLLRLPQRKGQDITSHSLAKRLWLVNSGVIVDGTI
ncbi:hypothetical protein M8C21_005871, partial [Ambrosia artemisiifolia]